MRDVVAEDAAFRAYQIALARLDENVILGANGKKFGEIDVEMLVNILAETRQIVEERFDVGVATEALGNDTLGHGRAQLAAHGQTKKTINFAQSMNPKIAVSSLFVKLKLIKK